MESSKKKPPPSYPNRGGGGHRLSTKQYVLKRLSDSPQCSKIDKFDSRNFSNRDQMVAVEVSCVEQVSPGFQMDTRVYYKRTSRLRNLTRTRRLDDCIHSTTWRHKPQTLPALTRSLTRECFGGIFHTPHGRGLCALTSSVDPIGHSQVRENLTWNISPDPHNGL